MPLNRPYRTRCRYDYPSNGLTSRHGTDSQAHSSIGTPPPPPPRTRGGTGSDGSQAPGFRYSFTPLPGYFSPFPHGTHPLSVTRKYSGSQVVLADSHRIPRAPCYHGNTPTRHQPGSAYRALTHYGPPSQTVQLPSQPAPPTTAAAGNRHAPTTPPPQPPPGLTRQRFSHHPLSLATTHGISSPTGTKMFHFPA